jgi:hypothetical protein
MNFRSGHNLDVNNQLYKNQLKALQKMNITIRSKI